MFTRDIAQELSLLAKDYPVVTVTGPRQSGKTTLAKTLFPDKPYFNLEAPDLRLLAEMDPRAFLDRCPEGAILDEIQQVPSLLSYIQVIVDEKKQKGMFILTGSHQMDLHQAISQSLAGRTALLKLLPLSINELRQNNISYTVDDYLLNGFYPRIYQDHLDPTRTYRNYLQTYLERDVRKLINIQDLIVFQRFIKLCAGRVGQMINYSNLSNEVGVSHHTIEKWLSILEASYLIFRLPPYFENFGKRVIKSPKLYFTDVGLLTYLLDIENITQLSRDPLRGQIFENLVILEFMKTRLNRGLEPQLYYYRDNQQHEVDVIFKTGNLLIPIEIKSAQTFQSEFTNNLNYFQKLVGERCPQTYLMYAGEQEQKIKNTYLCNYQSAATILLNCMEN